MTPDENAPSNTQLAERLAYWLDHDVLEADFYEVSTPTAARPPMGDAALRRVNARAL